MLTPAAKIRIGRITRDIVVGVIAGAILLVIGALILFAAWNCCCFTGGAT